MQRNRESTGGERRIHSYRIAARRKTSDGLGNKVDAVIWRTTPSDLGVRYLREYYDTETEEEGGREGKKERRKERERENEGERGRVLHSREVAVVR